MAIAELYEWHQNDGTYATGVAIIGNFPQFNHLKPLLQGGENSYTRDALEAAASEILIDYQPEADSEPEKENPAPAPSPSFKGTRHPQGRHKLGQTEGYPDHLVKLDREALLKMKKVDELRAFLYSLPEGEELKKVALKIVELDKAVQFAFDQLHFYAKTGEVMPGTGPPEGNQKMARMMAAIANHPPYISKKKKSKDPDVLAEVARREKELAEAKEFMQKHL